MFHRETIRGGATLRFWMITTNRFRLEMPCDIRELKIRD